MIIVAAGSSLPFQGLDSQEIVRAAFRAIARLGSVRRASSLYSSPAWPDPSDPPFVNAAVVIETEESPEALLEALHAIEAAFGRRRGVRNAPRTLDLDLIAYDDEKRSGRGLELPHPRLAGRAFVLVPLAEIAPDWKSPATGETAMQMLARTDPGGIVRIGA
ncbi:MAG: 2-amino-4-hydroxy-6-hydroxymethyldihydropteridine diphosphokinase [Parvularculaceae bacterium]